MTVVDCPVCRGEGTVPVAGESLNRFSGVRGFDPQEERDVRCSRCRGSGVLAEDRRVGRFVVVERRRAA